MHSDDTRHGLIGIDWGTTHRRAYWLDAQGRLQAELADDQGLLAAQGRFAASFDALLAPWPSQLPVLMSGMVGAASGWQEAPYLDAEAPLMSLAQALVVVREAPRARIVPGLRWRGGAGEVDVMRGEETQLLGALALGQGDGWYVLPGTHSKWVQVKGGAVQALRTYMTGELFALLGQHGTLAGMVAQGVDDAAAFRRGLAAAGEGALSHTLFGCRARVVAGDMPAAQARSYLSGLLIGAEWHDALAHAAPTPGQVTLIGSPALADGYKLAALQHGCAVNVLDPREVYLAALWALRPGAAS
ncbi:MAG: 2-dehydro-3-deoxygalactonokinase [Rhizobacter sp.]|nr:2-dehydro-3-deoxygalactonokinase [Rhizobacter sp.]